MTPLSLTLKNNLSEIVRSAKAIETHGEARGWPSKWVTSIAERLRDYPCSLADG